ncbi:ligase-associated DNA damage response endonuclease PdeM [Polycladidibacter hongkongensis]|uniref:ligase-associated DNA damage response endonuclease PdeM n=1 Tax=Polycladidibacter hongkongensis TaxID=1647556 RepID=UPI0009EB648D|nr:ligase-associated DNA damage response endonuclease PdeM [Pseudovibrio hongkongensis]
MFGETELSLLYEGALWLPAARVLVVSDLHLGKAAAFAQAGVMLPPYDSHATLQRLADVVQRLQPVQVVCLGDSFHRPDSAPQLPQAAKEQLKLMQQGRDWVWILGNHDAQIGGGMDRRQLHELAIGALQLRHEPTAISQGDTLQICGHYHPAAKIRRMGRSVRRRCFAYSDQLLVLPAFGAFTGGLNLLDEAFTSVFTTQTRLKGVVMLGQEQLYNVHPRALVQDGARIASRRFRSPTSA